MKGSVLEARGYSAHRSSSKLKRPFEPRASDHPQPIIKDWDNLRPVRIRLRDQTLLAELRQHFERSGFVVRELGTATIEATRPDAPNVEQGEREVEAHLAVWNVIHPDVASREPE